MITCYLDSQDYSNLTDPKTENDELRKIKFELINLARTKQVKFVFSEIIVGEIISLKKEVSRLAEMKAEFISEICGSNALISVDRLIDGELRALAERSAPPAEIFDPRGRWFPELDISADRGQSRDESDDTLRHGMQDLGVSRQHRRAMERAAEKKKRKTDSSTSPEDTLDGYSVPAQYIEIEKRYELGQATISEYHEVLINCLSDPLWAMKWFSTKHSMARIFSEAVRGPAKAMAQNLRYMIEFAQAAALRLQEISHKDEVTGKKLEMPEMWRGNVEKQLVAIPKKMALAKQMVLDERYTFSDVDQFCPGIATAVRSLFSSVWASVGEGHKRPLSDSQPVDVFHAYYAPYVDFFRADRFMAPHIQKHVKDSGTVVVPQLTKLLLALNERLERSAQFSKSALVARRL